LELGKNSSDVLNTLLLSHDARFYVPGYVNKQTCHHWAPNNPNKLYRHPQLSADVAVQCEVYSHGIIGPYFFENA
jgi:hypothetical protein